MKFLSDDFSVKIISVLSLSWQATDTAVLPRPYNALSFRIKGDSVFSSGENSVNATTGDLLFMPEKVGYRLKSGTEEILAVHFELCGIKQNNFEVIKPRDPELYRELFTSLYEIWGKKSAGYNLRAMSVFYRILERIVRDSAAGVRPVNYPKIKEAVTYLHAHYTDNSLTVEQLALMSGISDTYFRGLFAERFGTTPVKYLASLRVTHAAELLASGYYTVERAAYESGFSDAKYFSTVFKKIRGCPPSAYKI